MSSHPENDSFVPILSNALHHTGFSSNILSQSDSLSMSGLDGDAVHEYSTPDSVFKKSSIKVCLFLFVFV